MTSLSLRMRQLEAEAIGILRETIAGFRNPVLLYSIGQATGVGGWALVLWGIPLRLVLVYHVTWLVNSATHRWGYVSHASGDHSRNNWWVALLTFGEGWHNNHHAYPSSARMGFRWWEFDLTWLHVFRYSPRQGTPAARMPQVPGAAIKDRAARLRAMGEVAAQKHLAAQLGQTHSVLLENPRMGRTEQFTEVTFATDQPEGAIIPARITGHAKGQLTASSV